MLAVTAVPRGARGARGARASAVAHRFGPRTRPDPAVAPASVRSAALAAGGCVALGRSRRRVATEALGSSEGGDLSLLQSRSDNSWLRELVCDPEAEANRPNKSPRQVRSGHFVPVEPTPLPEPYLVAYSRDMADELALDEATCQSKAFADFFSGNMSAAPGFSSWATPYALSIFGQEMYDNCPFKNGNGYGDGRALSVGEVIVSGKRWEMQLKGGGQTPFCRGADGRAVLRSSVREFLASEAMHKMGVETTRALSLVASGAETVGRPWYSEKRSQAVDEALLLQYAPQMADAPQEVKEMGLKQLRYQLQNPDVMQTEPCAITCRVAPSFFRVGHLELHGRRARQGGQMELEHLELAVRHALMREYADIDDPSAPLQSRILLMAREFARRLSRLVADWLRVGYCQGNFNSDNCLIAGRTMDYGPFGFIEKYDPKWNMWVGGGEHYAFRSQPRAAHRNFFSFVRAVAPLLDEASLKEAQEVVNDFVDVCQDACNDMWRRKLGLSAWSEDASELFGDLEVLLLESGVDYTIFWRQLAALPPLIASDGLDCWLSILMPAFYAAPEADLQERWASWIGRWSPQCEGDPQEISEAMRKTSPKYIPREWMLVEAYTAANRGDHSVLKTLQQLFSRPFDEQPEFEKKYYRRAPEGVLHSGGTAFMS
mmetsp:Transcript_56119/g.121417  ORF Transcript_56119/g.121417 Transcript_56119/m.121417 type:complete len:659 (-) Transcript_56119:240-2216(-)